MTIKRLIAIPTALALMLAFVFGAFGFANSANAQVGTPRLAIQLATTGLTSPLVASSTDATVARLILDTTGSTEAVRISSLPFILTTGSGAVASDLTNCTVANETALGTDLSSNMGISAGLNNIALNSPLILAANTVTTLALRCDVLGSLVAGGTYTFSMNTANVAATGASTGLPAIVTVRGAVVVPPVIPPIVIPGLPTTGAEGESRGNIGILIASTLAGIAGLALMRKSEKRA